MTVFQEGQVVNWNDGAGTEREGTIVRAHRFSGGWNVLDARGEHWSLGTQELRPAEPRPGDVVRVVALHPDSCFSGKLFPDSKVDVGEERILRSIKDTSTKSEWAVAELDGASVPGCCKLIVIRRASTPAGEAARFYTKQPDVLPETLPVGTRGPNGLVARSILKLEVEGYLGDWGESFQQYTVPSRIDWTTVTIQPSPPPVGSPMTGVAAWLDPQTIGNAQAVQNAQQQIVQQVAAQIQAGGGSSKADPYEAHRSELRRKYAITSEGQIARAQQTDDDVRRHYPFGPQRDELDRIVAARIDRRRHLEQAKSELDRKLPASTHPSAWPEGAGEELRCT